MVFEAMEGFAEYASAVEYLYRIADEYGEDEEFADGIRYAADALKEFFDDQLY